MLTSRSMCPGAARGKAPAGLFLFAMAALLMSGTALAANPGDEVPFREGEPMPPAPVGMSWCLVQKPAVYDTATETVVLRAKATFQVPVAGEYSNRTEKVPTVPAYRVGRIVPAQLGAKNMTYISQEGYEALEIVPPEFKDTVEEIEVCPAYEEITVIPAEFRNTTKRLLVDPARKTFQRDVCSDGGLLCWTVCETSAQFLDVPTKELIADAREERTTVPAKIQKVMVRKLVTPATVRKMSVPPKTIAYQAGVVTAPPRVEWQTVPAESRDVTVRVETKAPSFVSQELPEKTETLSRRVLKQPEQLVWRLESKAASAPVVEQSCYATGNPCAVAKRYPTAVSHSCSW